MKCRVLYVNRNKHKGCCGYTKSGSTGKGVKLSLCMPWKHVGGVEVQLHSFLILALDGCECSASPQPPLAKIFLQLTKEDARLAS